MRHNLTYSTAAERRVHEVLKELHIPFKHRWKIGSIEADFLIGNVVLEIDGHTQNVERNNKIVELGLIPIHINNMATKDPHYLKQLILNL